MIADTIKLIAGGVVFLGVILSSVRTVRQTQRGLIERFGKFSGFANPGLHFIIPIADRMILVNITEKMVTAEPQQIITLDKLNAQVDAQIYYKVKEDAESVRASQYNVNDIDLQIVSLAQTTLRNIIGSMNLADANSKRGKINQALFDILQKETKTWGIDIVRTELKEIDPPKDVQESMNNVIKAENDKIAAIDTASALENEADGKRRAAIKEAEGVKQSKILEAQGEAESIRLVNEAAQKYFKGEAQLLKKLEVTENSLKDNTKVLITEKGISPVLVLGEDKILPLQKPKSGRENQ